VKENRSEIDGSRGEAEENDYKGAHGNFVNSWRFIMDRFIILTEVTASQ